MHSNSKLLYCVIDLYSQKWTSLLRLTNTYVLHNFIFSIPTHFLRIKRGNIYEFNCRRITLHSPTMDQVIYYERQPVKLKQVNSLSHSQSLCVDLKTHLHFSTEKKLQSVVAQKENIKTIPNFLTALRIMLSPLLGVLVVCQHFEHALGIFVMAGISDLMDGYIARNCPNQASALGSILDPLADKLLVSILTISLATVNLIPLPLTCLILLRDILLVAGGFYIRYRSIPPPVNTGMQLLLLAFSLSSPVFHCTDHIFVQVLWWTTGMTTLLSGLVYLCSWKKCVRLLKKSQAEL